MSQLILMVGCPGAGKTTTAQKYVEKLPNAITISRDAIRFSLLQPEQDYWDCENDVVKEFWKQINNALLTYDYVIADQTSLTTRARKWLLDHIKGYSIVSALWIDETLETCLQRNNMRRGAKNYVPEANLKKMYNNLETPTLEEGFDIIYRYNSNKDYITLYRREDIPLDEKYLVYS